LTALWIGKFICFGKRNFECIPNRVVVGLTRSHGGAECSFGSACFSPGVFLRVVFFLIQSSRAETSGIFLRLAVYSMKKMEIVCGGIGRRFSRSRAALGGSGEKFFALCRPCLFLPGLLSLQYCGRFGG